MAKEGKRISDFSFDDYEDDFNTDDVYFLVNKAFSDGTYKSQSVKLSTLLEYIDNWAETSN